MSTNNYNVSMNLISVYNKISYLGTFQERASKGTMGNLLETGEGWLLKSDKPGEAGVAWEYKVYEHLQDAGLDLAPECALEEGVFGHPNTIMLRKINNGATLQDYVEAYLEGIIPVEPVALLMEAVAKLLDDFWSAGYTHRDLHLRNIVVGMNRKGDAWRPYIIDFSSTTHEEQLEEFCYEEGLIEEEMATQEDDRLTFEEELWNLVDGDPPGDFHKITKFLP